MHERGLIGCRALMAMASHTRDMVDPFGLEGIGIHVRWSALIDDETSALRRKLSCAVPDQCIWDLAHPNIHSVPEVLIASDESHTLFVFKANPSGARLVAGKVIKVLHCAHDGISFIMREDLNFHGQPIGFGAVRCSPEPERDIFRRKLERFVGRRRGHANIGEIGARGSVVPLGAVAVSPGSWIVHVDETVGIRFPQIPLRGCNDSYKRSLSTYIEAT